MSTILSAREREVQNLLRQKEAELKQANAELEERGKLLYKTKVAIEQLQSELTTSRKEEAVIREEAQRIYDEQSAELRRAEEQLTAVEAALQQRTGQAQQLQSRITELEAELESSKHEQRTFGSAYAAKDRDNIRRIEGLQDEVEHQQDQITALEKLLRERTAQSIEHKDKLATATSEREEADRSVKDLLAKNQRLAEEKERLEQQIKTKYQQQFEDLQQQVSAATAQADARLKEKTAADKEWGKRLAAKEKEGHALLKEAEAKIKELDERSAAVSRALSDAEGQLSQANLTRQRQIEDAQGLWARQMAEVEAAWEKRVAGVQRAADEAMVDAQRDWERRLRDCEAGWSDKLQQAETSWAMKSSREQQQWEHAQQDWEHWRGRVQDEIEAAQAEAAREARRAAAAELAELESHAKADKLNTERSWALRLEQVEQAWSERLQTSLATANSRVEEWKQRAGLDAAKSAEAQALKAAEAQARWHKQLDELKRKWAAEQVSSDKAWAAKLEEAHNKWLKERHQLESAAAARLQAAEAAAAAHADGLRSKLEGRIATIASRLGQLAAQEETRERKRQELAAQVEELRTAGADEFQRRLSLEATLRQAAALFKKELASKSDEVSGLQAQLRGMRHELADSNACNAAAVAAAGAVRSAAAAAGYGSCCSSPTAAAGVRAAGAAACPSYGYCSLPTAAAAAAGEGGDASVTGCSCSPSAAAAAAARDVGGSDAAAAAAVAAELQALRASRVGYQSALLQQQAVRNSLLSSLGDRLEECAAARSRSPSRSPVRRRHAPASADQHLLKAQHNHWHNTPPPAPTAAAAAAGARQKGGHARKCLFSSPQPAACNSSSKSGQNVGANCRSGSATGGLGFHSSWEGCTRGGWNVGACLSSPYKPGGLGNSTCSAAGLTLDASVAAAAGTAAAAAAAAREERYNGVDADDSMSDVTSQASQYAAWQQELSFRLGSALRKLEAPVL